MRTLLSIGMALSLVTVLGLSASAGTAGPAPRAVPVAGGGLFVESAESASSKVTVSGELRFRWENQENMQDTDSKSHDYVEYVDARARLGLLFELAEDTSVKVTLQSRYIWGGQNGIQDPSGNIDEEDRDSFDVYEAYVRMKPTIFGFETTLTVGRQELAFGNEMLLGDDTKYAGLSFDAVRLDLNPIENLDTALFVAKVVENSIERDENGLFLEANTGNAIRNDAHLFGIYNTYHLGEDALVDLYVLYFQNDNEGGGNWDYYANDEKVWTIGTRVAFDKLELYGQKFDFALEVAAQLGEVNIGGEDLDIQDAFAFEAELGWSPELPWAPRLAIGMAWASGDDFDTDGNFNTFRPLFADTQQRLGKSDVFALQNIRAAYIAVNCNPMDSEKISAGVAYYKFNAFEEGDDLGAGGVAAFTGSNVNDMADEFDMFAAYKISDNADLKLCWSWIEPDDMIHDAVGFANSPAHRVHLTLVVNF